MTSYVRVGLDTYNGMTAPQYNVISYTWGNFVDTTPTATAISIDGVDWPIPAILKTHFTPHAFKAAMERASKGVNQQCEWLWVDIACIPQKHEHEIKQAKDMRGQEIGRQVEIFRRAQEVFAWLPNLKASEFSGDLPLVTVHVFSVHVHRGDSVQDVESAADYLHVCDSYLSSIETWMWKFLLHPWLDSLWTLQEMVLRRDAYVLFDDGFWTPSSFSVDSLQDQDDNPWNFIEIKNDIFRLQQLLQGRGMTYIEDAENMLLTNRSGDQLKNSALNIRERLERLIEMSIYKGLNTPGIEIPHAAYSAAQNRNVRELTDRIYGIVQTYEISCNPDPTGDSELVKLQMLEDEFGTKLIAKSAVLSQLFIHTSKDSPRRSWLITQECAYEPFFVQYFRSGRIFKYLGSLNVLESTKNLRFDGKAWCLNFLLKSIANNLFQPPSGGLGGFNGLMLDHHVSKEVLRHVTGHLDSPESMSHAIRTLDKHYKGPTRVAVLGFAHIYASASFVGMVLAPIESCNGEPLWMRIGIYQWEEYGLRGPSPHMVIPPYEDFHCTVT